MIVKSSSVQYAYQHVIEIVQQVVSVVLDTSKEISTFFFGGEGSKMMFTKMLNMWRQFEIIS